MPSPPGDSQGPSLEQADSDTSQLPELPPPPTPSSDPSLVSFAAMLPESVSKGPYEEVWRMAPRTAMKILAISIEALVHSTGDIPSTAPSTAVTTHHLRGMQWEKDNIKRSNSERELALMRERAEAQAKAEAEAAAAMAPDVPLRRTPSHDLSLTPGPIDGIRLRSTSTSTFAHHPPPSSSSSSSEPKIVWANTEPHKEQHNAITRKFYCRKPPPITVTDYLERLHSYCPTSTAVYLATSLYIYRLAVDERVIHVTPRTVHRLVLGALRVTMKALEDQRYGHRKMARVGGVGEPELARLEIGFCFLTNFELFLRDADLAAHLEVLRRGEAGGKLRLLFPLSGGSSEGYTQG